MKFSLLVVLFSTNAILAASAAHQTVEFDDESSVQSSVVGETSVVGLGESSLLANLDFVFTDIDLLGEIQKRLCCTKAKVNFASTSRLMKNAVKWTSEDTVVASIRKMGWERASTTLFHAHVRHHRNHRKNSDDRERKSEEWIQEVLNIKSKFCPTGLPADARITTLQILMAATNALNDREKLIEDFVNAHCERERRHGDGGDKDEYSKAKKACPPINEIKDMIKFASKVRNLLSILKDTEDKNPEYAAAIENNDNKFRRLLTGEKFSARFITTSNEEEGSRLETQARN